MNTKLNKTDIILLGVYFLVSISIQGIEYYERNALLKEYIFDFPVQIITICSVLFLFIFWLTPKLVKGKKFVLIFNIGLLLLIFFTSIEYTVCFWSENEDWAKYPKGIDFILHMINRGARQVAFPFALLLSKKFYEGQNEYLKIQKQQKENELKLLRSQLDPHFLFNNLNTLDALIDSDPEKAKEYINRLSLIYRYLIQTKDAEVMELIDELSLAENYIFLIQTRFGADYDFSINKKSLLLDKFVPTGAIQTLLENVVKHNKSQNGNQIKATILVDDDWLTVTNTKSKGIQTSDSLGTGLKNLKARYQLLSDQNIQVEESDSKYKITIPIIKLSTDT